MVIDLKQIDLLAKRVVKATELIRSLRSERDAAYGKLRETQQALEQMQVESKSVDKDRQDMRGLSEQIDILQEERQTIRGRVTRMIELMAGLDEGSAQAHGDH